MIYSSLRDLTAGLLWRAADGTGAAELLGEREGWRRYPLVVAPDGNGVVAMEVERAEGGDLIMVSLNGDPVTEDLLATAFDERGATLSPNGRWFAYQSDASGQMGVYISFPGCGR